MGEFFKDEPSKIKKEEPSLITSYDDLREAYRELEIKIGETRNRGYEVVLPIRYKLLGGGKSPDDIGLVGKLRGRIRTTGIAKMDVGQMMWSSLENIEDLSNWTERFIQFLEDYIDGLIIVCKSAFTIISALHKDIDGMRIRIRQLEDNIIAQGGPLPELHRAKKEEPPIVVEPVEGSNKINLGFANKLAARLNKYRDALKLKDEKMIKYAKKYIDNLHGEDEELKKFVDDEFERVFSGENNP